MGNFKCELREDLVPLTVGNFVKRVHEKYHDGTRFNRVVKDFVIQAGINDGTIEQFDDEFHPELKHDQAGVLSMGNVGPNTNDVEFFITLDAFAYLDNNYSVFGKVIEGMDVVFDIGDVVTFANEEPAIEVSIDSIRIISGMVLHNSLLDPGQDWGRLNNSLHTSAISFSQAGNYSIKMIDVSGRVLKSFNIINAENYTLPLPTSSGSYLIKITGQYFSVTAKFYKY